MKKQYTIEYISTSEDYYGEGAVYQIKKFINGKCIDRCVIYSLSVYGYVDELEKDGFKLGYTTEELEDAEHRVEEAYQNYCEEKDWCEYVKENCVEEK